MLGWLPVAAPLQTAASTTAAVAAATAALSAAAAAAASTEDSPEHKLEPVTRPNSAMSRHDPVMSTIWPEPRYRMGEAGEADRFTHSNTHHPKERPQHIEHRDSQDFDMPQLASSQDVIDQVIIRLVEFQRQQQRQEAEQTKQGRKMFNLDDMSLSRASPLSMDAETPIGLEDELAGRVETKLSIAS